MTALALAALLASTAHADDEPTARVLVQQSYREFVDDRAVDAVERFFVFGDTHRLHHAVDIDPWSGATVNLSREHHWARETVTVGGQVQHLAEGAQVVWTVRTTDERGRTQVTTREWTSGDMPVVVDSFGDE